MVGQRCNGVSNPCSIQLGPERDSDLSDEELLERFLVSPESAAEDAFSALVRRHGPMVLGVCRQILRQHQDAEDAFQATFLVLARKAGAIRARNVLGRWLYEVAYRTAVRARITAVRRQNQERRGVEMMAVATDDQTSDWDESRPILHEEVRRLPEKYRAPIVLCYLEGKTNEEAARLLKWPVGTVKGRLSQARELLGARLKRRGIALSLALLMVTLSKGKGFAATVPEPLVARTARLAVRVRAWNAAAPQPSPQAQWMGQALRASLRLKNLTAAVLLVTVVVALTHVFNALGNGASDGSRRRGSFVVEPALGVDDRRFHGPLVLSRWRGDFQSQPLKTDIVVG